MILFVSYQYLVTFIEEIGAVTVSTNIFTLNVDHLYLSLIIYNKLAFLQCPTVLCATPKSIKYPRFIQQSAVAIISLKIVITWSKTVCCI